MYKGRTYKQTGWGGFTIQFADKTKNPGCATVTYNKYMTQDEKHELARRITAALNATRYMTTEQIEAFQEVPGDE